MNDASDKYINKSLFKDKKLNKLWEKALLAGFSKDELSALKEEFHHHQDKVDQYYQLLYDIKKQVTVEQQEESKEIYNVYINLLKNTRFFVDSVDNTLDKFNNIETLEERGEHKDYLNRANMIRKQHRDIKDGYDHLDKLAASGPASREFVEPQVHGKVSGILFHYIF